ncbi:hypothetical protein A9Z42_0018300 [Trichoderma parareesei]|uniref:Uncharacterized protein n=1 Tax=Trichoderma parareesei TaxID=858221 RepID=A0A2H2YYM8_TRIPA|nr:hypothetical protein A9Z42_0018300 [Trichoderma parareesei]
MRNDSEAAGNLNFDMFLSKEHDWHEVHVQTVTDTEKSKRILSLIIGYAVLHLDGTHWLQRSWGSADIKFFQTTSHKTPLQPYIQVNLSKPNTAADSACPTKDYDDKDVDELDSGHRCPALIALAVVLMEVHFAKPLERLAQISGVPLETRCRRVTLQDVVDVLDGVEDNEVKGWRNEIPEDSAMLIAIDNCLTPELWEDDQGDVLDSRTLKSRIYDRVIRLLEQHLTSGFSTIPLDGVDGYAKQMDFAQWGQRFSDQEPGVLMPSRGQRPPTAVHSVLPAATLPLRGRARIQPAVPELEGFICQYAQATSTASMSSFIMDTTSVIDSTIGYKNSRFFDDETAADGEPSNARTRAYLRWRCEYEKVYDKFIFTYLQDSPPSNPVKIAILDTGIDRDHPDFDSREDRIKARRNCYNESQKNTPDLNGHGTFTASLILDYARDADLYVAKIADRDNTTPNAGSVAKAIHHAVDEWKVDIISLSFGWPSIDFDGYDALDDAIAKADANKVLLFAAASNSGGRLPRAYPASSSHVICVHSTDTMGNASNFSPTAQPYSLNLATVALKKYVSSRSGTSYATPIMAGIAAFLLQYARLHLPEQASRLQKKENMEALLRRCAERGSNYTPRDNYFYVALSLDRQTLFGRDLDKINDEILKALQR